MNKTLSILSLLALVFLSSCAPYYYNTTAVNTPMFTDKGQAHVSATGCMGVFNDNIDGGSPFFFDAQTAYSPINHLGVMLNYSSNSYNNDPYTGHVFSNYIEGGVGGYYAIGNKRKLINELYGGIGIGKMRTAVNMNYSRMFLQYGIGFKSDIIDAIFNLRLCNLKFYNLDTKGNDNDHLRYMELMDANGGRIDDKALLFVEPTITLRTGYKFIKVQMQLSFIQSPTPQYWPYNFGRYTVGIYFEIEDLLKTINSNNSY